MRPLVSIIVTCFDKKPYLDAMLESVEQQTYGNVEIVLVDDGSTDGSCAVLEAYATSHDNATFMSLPNLGVSAARNTGIKAAKGFYVMSLDADDRIEATYVERCVEVLEQHPEIKVAQTQACYFGEKEGMFKVPNYSFEGLLWTNLIHYCAMYRRSDFLSGPGYNTNMVYGLEDWDFWLSMLKPDDRVFTVDEPLFHWRVLSKSRSNEAQQHEVECYRQLFENHRELYAPFVDRLVYYKEKWSQSDTLYHEALAVRQSRAYRIGKLITHPTSFLTYLKLKNHCRLHVVFHLAINGLLRWKLRLKKWFKGIKKPIIHYYAVCWNEEKMLPFVLDYYGQFVDHFFFYDNYSSDRTKEIIASVPNATWIPFGKEGQFDDSENQKVKNEAWKRSRGRADFVVVCDMDEFLYHPDLLETLSNMRRQHVSIPLTKGFEMYAESFPDHQEGKLLTEAVQNGIRDMWYDKFLVFDPHKIVEMNYAVGAHEANPLGWVKYSEDRPLKVLHYKNLGIDYLLERYRLLGERLSAFNVENHFGMHYLEDEQAKRAEMEQGLAQAKNVLTDEWYHGL